MIKFKVSKEEASIISAIARRSRACGIHTDLMSAEMDITATHRNGNPLRLGELLNSDNFNFTHDIAGIARHLNRQTGALENCFVPRFTIRDYDHGKDNKHE